jgi:hypothetical protein
LLKEGDIFVEKDTLKFINGQQNVTIDRFILGREKVGNSELIFVSLPEYEEPLFALWNSKKEAKKHKKTEIEGDIVFEVKEPKSAGNKETYVMLMPNAIAELNKKKVSIESLGFLMKITDRIEWNTGRLIRKRDKKSMTVDMLAKYAGIGILKTKSIIKELSKNGVLFYLRNERAYFINPDYMRKGGGSYEDKV